MAQEVISGIYPIKINVSFSTNNLKNHDSKAEHIRFHRKLAKHCIFRRHVATKKQQTINGKYHHWGKRNNTVMLSSIQNQKLVTKLTMSQQLY